MSDEVGQTLEQQAQAWLDKRAELREMGRKLDTEGSIHFHWRDSAVNVSALPERLQAKVRELMADYVWPGELAISPCKRQEEPTESLPSQLPACGNARTPALEDQQQREDTTRSDRSLFEETSFLRPALMCEFSPEERAEHEARRDRYGASSFRCEPPTVRCNRWE